MDFAPRISVKKLNMRYLERTVRTCSCFCIKHSLLYVMRSSGPYISVVMKEPEETMAGIFNMITFKIIITKTEIKVQKKCFLVPDMITGCHWSDR